MEQLCWKCRAPAEIVPPLGLPEVPSRVVAHLLNNNDVPLESDIPFICDIISSEEDRMGALDVQIRSLQAVLTQLARTRDEAAERLRQHRAVLSPIRCVPQELICEILALAWFSGDDDINNMPRSPPWHFGHICRSWRSAALSYIPLWCSIIIPSIPTPEIPHLLETQLLRSGNAPLRVYWQAKEYIDPEWLKPLVAQCSRWSALRLDAPFRAANSYFAWLIPIAGRLAQLQKLTVVNADNALWVSDVFLTTLTLRQVILTDPELSVPSSASIIIPWAQLTHYRGTYDMDRQLEILSAAPHLVECAVGLSGFGSLTGNLHEVALLPRLRRLCVKGPAILNHLKTPLLHTLYSLRNPIFRTLLPFVQRSACTLSKLVLVQCDVSDKLIPVLRGLPTLTYLLIDSQRDDGLRPHVALFDAMRRSGTSSELCPNLKSLLFAYERTSDDDNLDFPSENFFNMVQSRLEPNRPSRLEFLRIFYTLRSHVPPPIDIAVRLKAFHDVEDGGFNVALLNYRDFNALKARGDFF
ncbi:hypothetical protein B0H19DRAFT_1122328 [Mycena capillaripes]|nr:hypothetical protein B0H19DRAFT_1122328 [Mycena capillaripes]